MGLSRTMAGFKDDRVAQQTTEQWLAEYSDAKPNATVVKDRLITRLVFDHHRTTKGGAVVLSFRHRNEEIVAFFNCDIRRQRGKQKGQSYRSGLGGQFLPRPRSKFRAFWLECTGKAPRRWAAVHKEIGPRLKSLEFKGDITTEQSTDGKIYKKVTNLRLLNIGF